MNFSKTTKIIYSILLTFILVHFTLPQEVTDSTLTSATNSTQTENLNALISNINLKDYPLNLPIETIEYYKAQNEKGVVIFLPQIHKSPGTNTSEKLNDSAERAQNEIYEILEYLHEEKGVDFIMSEGGLYGETSPEKIADIAEMESLKKALKKEISLFEESVKKEPINPELEKRMTNHMNDFIDFIDREIVLAGAPYVLKAEHNDITVYGSENQSTYEECAKIIKNYVYLKDREQQMKGVVVSNPQLNSSSILESLGLMSSGQNNSTAAIKTDFSLLRIYASFKKNNDVVGIINNTENIFNTLQKNISAKNQTSSMTGSRQNNPYSSVSNPQKIEDLILESEKEIQKMVINQRNKETAENFAKALEEKNETTGILQFGAGHEEGLVEELNKQGLSVIVIKSNEVVDRENKN